MIDMRKRNGFSLVEVVIALSIIVIVSISAISIMASSIATKATAINKTQAQNFADNVWECFKAAEDEEEFISLVSFAEGITLSDGIADGNGNNVYTYHSGENKFTAQISVKFPADTRSEFNINVTDENGESIISFSYQKGGGI